VNGLLDRLGGDGGAVHRLPWAQTATSSRHAGEEDTCSSPPCLLGPSWPAAHKRVVPATLPLQ